MIDDGVGFAIFASLAVTVFLSWAIPIRSPFGIAFCLFFAFFPSLALFSWAHSVSIAEGHKVIQACAVIIGCAVVGIVSLEIVKRAPPSALFACLSVFLGCALCGALVMFAPFKNFVLLAIIIAVLALVVIVAILAWFLDRADERAVYKPQHPAAIQPPNQTQTPLIASREVRRGKLLAPPAKRSPFEEWGRRGD